MSSRARNDKRRKRKQTKHIAETIKAHKMRASANAPASSGTST